MKRRRFLRGLVALPAAAVGLARFVAPVVAGRLPFSPEAFDAFLRRTVHLRLLEENAIGRVDWRVPDDRHQALSIEKMEAAIDLISSRSGEPMDLTPRFIAISPARARAVARDHGIEIVWRRR